MITSYAKALGLFLLAISTNGLRAASYSLTVPATANIHSAGLSVPVDPGGGGAGTLPLSIALNPGENRFTLSASGLISQLYDGYYHGPDGYVGWGLNINAYGGVSGFLAEVTLPLAAVFLTDATPAAPAPPTIDFQSVGIGTDFASLSPQIGQIFFVGDGAYSGGSQTFYVPTGATRLFIGFPDALTGTGDPGSFGENFGSLSVNVVTAPEPTIGSLLTIGVLMFFRRRRNCR